MQQPQPAAAASKMPMLIDMQSGAILQLRKHLIDARVLIVSDDSLVLILDANSSIQVFSPDGKARRALGVPHDHFGILPNQVWPWARTDATAVYRHGQVYVIGGNNGSDRGSTQMDVLDVGSMHWLPGIQPRLISARKDHTSALVNGTLYVCGCHKNSMSCRHSCEVLAPNSTRWRQLSAAPIPHCSWWSSSAVLTQPHYRLLLIGSYCPGRDAQVHQYNAHTKRWTELANLLHGRSGSSAVTLGGRVYVCGGLDYSMNTLRSCEVYDPTTDVWSWALSMRERRAWLQMTAVSGRLYAIGGHNGSHLLDTIETIAPEKESGWSPLPYRLLAPTITHTVVTVPL